MGGKTQELQARMRTWAHMGGKAQEPQARMRTWRVGGNQASPPPGWPLHADGKECHAHELLRSATARTSQLGRGLLCYSQDKLTGRGMLCYSQDKLTW
jgi:hypothetical protein